MRMRMPGRVLASIVVLCALATGCPDDDGGGGGTLATTGTGTDLGTATSGPVTTGTTASDETTSGATVMTFGGEGGGGCQSDEDCGDGEICADAPNGECVCGLGLARCGGACVDLAAEDSHCGRCNLECPANQPCSQGVCGGLVDPPGIEIGAPELVSGGSPSTECLRSNEAKPERSINALPGGVGDFAAVQSSPIPPSGGSMAVTDASGVWSPDLRLVPVDAGAPFSDLGGDPWTTTHGGTGLEYASFIGVIDGVTWCPAVAATTSDALLDNDWLAPAACAIEVQSGTRADGPLIRADLGSDAIYVAYTALAADSRFTLARFSPCTGPVIGDADDCPFQSSWLRPARSPSSTSTSW